MSRISDQQLAAFTTMESGVFQTTWYQDPQESWFPWDKLRSFAQAVFQRLLPWIVPMLLVSVWQISSVQGWISVRVLPAPLSVVDAAWTLAESGELWKHVQISAGRALLGLVVGGGLAPSDGPKPCWIRPFKWCATFQRWL
jgi:hypothetical protein